MAKLSRVFQKVFMLNGSASHCGQFGSKAAGSPVPSLDPNTIQALAAFVTNGWTDAVVGANKQPFLEDMNGLFRLAFYQICSVFQDGIPTWDASTEYVIGSIVRKDGTFEQYGSLVNSNIGNTLPSQANNASWQYLNPASVPPGIMSDFGGTVAPFGYLLCDGSSYATASYPALFAAIGYANGGSGANFNVPDCRGRATIGSGQGSGLTNRTYGQNIGEETHVLVTGEMPSHSHSVTDPGHNHSQLGSLTPSISVDNTGSTRLVVNGTSSVSSSTTGITLGNTGGGGAHNNMQPSLVVTKVIKI